MLEIFISKTPEQMLDEEEVLNILTSSNRLYRQVNQKLIESEDKRTNLKKEERKF